MSNGQRFTIYLRGAQITAATSKKQLRQLWREAVKDQGGTPVDGYGISVQQAGERIAISGIATRGEPQ